MSVSTDMGKIKFYRWKIDNIDRNIVKLLMLRFKIVRQIGIYKKGNNTEVSDKKRELQVINNIKKQLDKKHQRFIIQIFRNIINYSKKLQR